MLPAILRTASVALLVGMGAAAAGAQDYEQRYGPIADVTLDDLYNLGESYQGRGVRTSGRLDMSVTLNGGFQLSEGPTVAVMLIPVPELQGQFEMNGRQYLGHRVEVVGLFDIVNSTAGQPRGVIRFWEFVGPPERSDDGEIRAQDVSLEDLLRTPERYQGEMIRIVGQFRGRNLYRDLPSATQRRSSDWVLKDDIFAVWVTGRPPRGDGFRLDASLKRDTGKWLEVVGRAASRGGTVYVDAARVRLTDAPLRVDAGAAPTPTPPPRPRVAPVVVFTLPLDGDEIPQSTQFQIQFSKDMDEASFRGRVVLRYAGPRLPGDRLFDGMLMSYDGGLRTLTVDPGDVLDPGREVRLLLLQGIQDVEGLNLEARSGSANPDEVVDELRYRVKSEFGGE